MRRTTIFVLVFVALLGVVAPPLFAQTSVQQSASHLDAVTQCVVSDPAGGTAGSASITPPSGQYVYVTLAEACAGATATLVAANPITATSTNLPNAVTIGLFNQSALTLGQLAGCYQYPFPNGLKSLAAGTATTIAGAATAGVKWHLMLCGFFAP